MCFSATASFGLAGLLSVIGALTLKRARYSNQAFFALIPLFFAVQQTLEGVLWLLHGTPSEAKLAPFFMYGYLFFALCFWPLWMPYAVLQLESLQNRKRIQILRGLQGVGVYVAIRFLIHLVTHATTVSFIGCHVLYDISLSHAKWLLLGGSYILATAGPFLVSSKKGAWLFGVASLIALGISWHVFYEHMISVWCFFAAALSVGVYWMLRAWNTQTDGNI